MITFPAHLQKSEIIQTPFAKNFIIFIPTIIIAIAIIAIALDPNVELYFLRLPFDLCASKIIP